MIQNSKGVYKRAHTCLIAASQMPSLKETTLISIFQILIWNVPPEVFNGSIVHQYCNDDGIPATQEAEIGRIPV
jgi:hypothetical protein